MASPSKRVRTVKPAEDYLELVRRHPLRSIRNDADLKAAHAMLDSLAIMDEERYTPGQADYLMALTDLIWAYEQTHDPIDVSDIDGIEALKFLLDENGMSGSDLGRLLGNRQLGPAILRRERQLSKSHIAKLCRRFKVSADLFLRINKKSRKAA